MDGSVYESITACARDLDIDISESEFAFFASGQNFSEADITAVSLLFKTRSMTASTAEQSKKFFCGS